MLAMASAKARRRVPAIKKRMMKKTLNAMYKTKKGPRATAVKPEVVHPLTKTMSFVMMVKKWLTTSRIVSVRMHLQVSENIVGIALLRKLMKIKLSGAPPPIITRWHGLSLLYYATWAKFRHQCKKHEDLKSTPFVLQILKAALLAMYDACFQIYVSSHRSTASMSSYL